MGQVKWEAMSARGPALAAWLVTSLGLLVLLAPACQLNTGPRVFQVHETGHLVGPKYADWADPSRIVHRRHEGSRPEDRDDTFAIVFNDAFFRYLPDPLGINEVVVVFTFTEEGTDTKAAPAITKVIGPMNRMPDGAYASELGTVVYGPKYLEGDSVRVDITIIEIDADERDNASALLDFTSGLAAKLADPVTSAEIALAKEVADTLIKLNENDIVLSTSITLQAFDAAPWKLAASDENCPKPIPLRSGTWGVIKEEATSPIQTFFFLTGKLEWGPDGGHCTQSALASLLTVPVDIVLLPITAVARGFFDVPSGKSQEKLCTEDGTGYFKDAGAPLTIDRYTGRIVKSSASPAPAAQAAPPAVGPGNGGAGGNTPPKRLAVGGEPYESKTWLTFDVIRGGDPTTWEFRKKLAPLEQQVKDLLERKTVAQVLNERKAAVLQAADAVAKAIDEMESDRRMIELVEPPAPFAFRDPANTLSITVAHAVDLAPNAQVIPATSTGLPAWSPTPETLRAGRTRFDLTSGGGATPPGEYAISFTAGSKTQIVDLKVIDPPVSAALTFAPAIFGTPAAGAVGAVAPAPWGGMQTLTIGGLSAELIDVLDTVLVTSTANGVTTTESFPVPAAAVAGAAGTAVDLTNTTGAAITGVTEVRLRFKHGLPDLVRT